MSPPADSWGQGGGVFCANPECDLHVRADDPRVRGSGHWAEIDGVVFDRHPLAPGGACYCSRCRSAAPTVAA